MKKFRQTGFAVTETGKDPQLDKDLTTIAGRWLWKRHAKGKVVEQMINEFSGNEYTTRFLDGEGNLKDVTNGLFKLSRSGGVKVLTVYVAGNPDDQGSFIYRVDPNRLVVVQGMMANEQSLPGTDRRVFWRISAEKPEN